MYIYACIYVCVYICMHEKTGDGLSTLDLPCAVAQRPALSIICWVIHFMCPDIHHFKGLDNKIHRVYAYLPIEETG